MDAVHGSGDGLDSSNGSPSVRCQVFLLPSLLLHWTVLAEGSPASEPAVPAISFQCPVLMEKEQWYSD